MRVTGFFVERMRNLHDVEISPAEGVNVVCGENAQGKTNLLEAIWLFTGARSFRGAKEAELIPVGESWARMSMKYSGLGRENSAAFCIGEKKSVLFNGVSLEAPQALAGRFCAVVFSPAHLSLVKGAPGERRRALDTVIGQIKPRYLTVLSEYNRLLQQRNTLLRDIAAAPALLDTLEVWDAALAERGSKIARTRRSFIERLQPVAQQFYDGIARGKECLQFSYSSCWGEDDAPQALLQSLKDSLADDLRTRTTSMGPHRDDLAIEIDTLPARAFASQGQQRSAVLAFKLGECALIEQVTGEVPVVLLDDVMSELDENRRNFLLHRLIGRQIFITCCDLQQIGGAGATFRVSAGAVETMGA